MSTADWMRSNLTTQGYCVSGAERRTIRKHVTST
jgi:hypothetical protein